MPSNVRACASPSRLGHRADPSILQRVAKAAAATTGLAKPATCHTVRHCFATHLRESGSDLRAVQERLDPKDIKTTRISPHVLNRGELGARSPVDVLSVLPGGRGRNQKRR